MPVRNVLEKNRIEYIDVLKGFLICTVVIGHVLVFFFQENSTERLDFRVIYSFHMFLFIFISGYLIGVSTCDITSVWIRKRFCRLMIPYFIWTMITLVFLGEVSIRQYFIYLVAPSFWFLIILFLCDFTLLCLNLICPIEKREKALILSIIFSGLIMVVDLKTRSILDITEIIHMYAIYLPFYFLGVFSYHYQEKIANIFNKGIYILLPLYPVSMILYTYKNHSTFVNYINRITPEMLPTGLLNTISVMYNHFIVAPLGCVFFSWFIYKVSMNELSRKQWGISDNIH